MRDPSQERRAMEADWNPEKAATRGNLARPPRLGTAAMVVALALALPLVGVWLAGALGCIGP